MGDAAAAALACADAVGTGARHHTAVADRALTIATLPSCGMGWASLRLPGLSTRHPELPANFATQSCPFDFAEKLLDAAIHIGQPDWTSTDHTRLFHEDAVAVRSSDGLARNPVATPADLEAHSLSSLKAPLNASSGRFAAAA